MSVRESVAAVDRRFSARQKLGGGAVLALLGIVLIAITAFTTFAPGALTFVLGAVGVILLAIGVLGLGTAGYRRAA